MSQQVNLSDYIKTVMTDDVKRQAQAMHLDYKLSINDVVAPFNYGERKYTIGTAKAIITHFKGVIRDTKHRKGLPYWKLNQSYCNHLIKASKEVIAKLSNNTDNDVYYYNYDELKLPHVHPMDKKMFTIMVKQTQSAVDFADLLGFTIRLRKRDRQ